MEHKWHKRRDVVFFRGSSTGCGTTVANNPRLKMAHISSKWNNMATTSSKGKRGMTDLAISDLTVRFKAFEQMANSIDKNEYRDLTGKKADWLEQTKYKYIMNIMGNAQAYRFPTEFYKGAVILNFANRETPKMWFEPLLKDGVNYVHIRDVKTIDTQEKLLYDKIMWLRENDHMAEDIAQNGIKMAETYINQDTISCYWYLLAYKLNRMCR